MICVSGFAITGAMSFKKSDGISSNPTAHFRFSFLRCLNTSFSDTILELNCSFIKFTFVGGDLQDICVSGKAFFFNRFEIIEKKLKNVSNTFFIG